MIMKQYRVVKKDWYRVQSKLLWLFWIYDDCGMWFRSKKTAEEYIKILEEK